MMFEILASIFLLFMAFIQDVFVRKLIFVFGIIGLWSYSLQLEPQRSFKNLPLSLLLIWALLGVFIHSFKDVSPICLQYYSVFLLSEGFVFLLAGAMLLRLLVVYTKNYRIYLPVLFIALVPWIREMRFSLIFGFAIALILYGLFNKKYLLAGAISWISMIVAWANWDYIQVTWIARPIVWREMILRIGQHPFVGAGFDKKFMNNMIFDESWGYLFRHNDYLSIGVCLGAIATILSLWFVIQVSWKIRYKLLATIPIAIAICAFFQATMFNSYKASVFLVSLAICLIYE